MPGYPSRPRPFFTPCTYLLTGDQKFFSSQKYIQKNIGIDQDFHESYFSISASRRVWSMSSVGAEVDCQHPVRSANEIEERSFVHARRAHCSKREETDIPCCPATRFMEVTTSGSTVRVNFVFIRVFCNDTCGFASRTFLSLCDGPSLQLHHGFWQIGVRSSIACPP